jgi:hypothetical protein
MQRLGQIWGGAKRVVRQAFWPEELTVQRFRTGSRTFEIMLGVGVLALTVYVWLQFRWLAVLVPVIGTVVYGFIRALIVSPAWLARGNVKLALSMVGGVVGWLMTNERVPSTEFYKACASLIPVLLLVFVLERRQEYRQSELFGERFEIVINIIVLVLAGGETLKVLAYDDASIGDARIVAGLIAFSVTSLTLSMVGHPSQRPNVGDE